MKAKSSKRKKTARRVVKVSATVDLALDRDSMATGGIDPRRHGCHMAVLAQSGSGKSFMVGRLIEELLIKTKARVVVLDPNSDFGRSCSRVWLSSIGKVSSDKESCLDLPWSSVGPGRENRLQGQIRAQKFWRWSMMIKKAFKLDAPEL